MHLLVLLCIVLAEAAPIARKSAETTMPSTTEMVNTTTVPVPSTAITVNKTTVPVKSTVKTTKKIIWATKPHILPPSSADSVSGPNGQDWVNGKKSDINYGILIPFVVIGGFVVCGLFAHFYGEI